MSASGIPVRWRFFSVIFILSFLSYLLRQHFPVAGEFMMQELVISELQMGWIYGAFFWGYLVFQIPGGILGKRFGPRLTLLVAGTIWILTCLLFALLPGRLETSIAGTVALLIAIRVAMGAAHAPIYPVQAASVERWFPVGQWALPNAVSSTGLSLGAALAAPIFTVVILQWGWRASFLVFVPIGFLFFGVWWWYARNSPREHPSMGADELATIEANRTNLTQDAGYGAWRQLLGHRETLLLALAYFTHNFVFYSFATWFFHYLVNVLGFSIIESGMLAAAPWLLGAVAATVGGWVCDTLCGRLGPNLGCRIPAMTGLVGTGVFLYLGLYSPSPYVAVALLSLCYAFTQFAEGSFWSAQIHLAGPYAAPACGLMNTGGSVSGIIVGPLMPFLALKIGWVAALSTGTLVAFFGAVLWLFIRVDRPFQPRPREGAVAL
ncbi:MFS transporter [Luminiphilus sp.]|nr:MFS transporter [Luminiphilus sp.]